MKIKSSLFVFGALLVLLCSCDDNYVFDDYKSFDGAWHKDTIVSFQFEQQDTTSLYNMFINLRNNNDYPYSNIFLIVAMQEPNNKTTIDTLEYEMAYPDGTLMGEGFTDFKESKLWYRENVKFPNQGSYKVSIQQAVREADKVIGVQELEGITEVGFRVETTEK
ncbi:gliding motility lipoprotein GldH [Flavobacterium litorale]|uniref:Gliding motility lipoprotein GldH n=1 Tax=Flavobacterium litorale TaxID=2856519 RepID=A0ABX8VEP6_9FLAO|nr:gliding motility lipoprotein GldH [Flavobacterium litorale]QYJ69114.1 gliding motility lipoprotein GldH [Flavobacterium litorale]